MPAQDANTINPNLQKIINLIRKEVFLVRESIDCVQDIGFPERRHERYDTLLLKDSYNSNIGMLIHYNYFIAIRDIILESYRKLKPKLASSASLAVSFLGLGACAEVTMKLGLECLKNKEIYNYGHFVTVILNESNLSQKSHQFLLFIPKGLESRPELRKAFSTYIPSLVKSESTDFIERLKMLPINLLEQILLVDGWRNAVEPLNERNLNDLVSNCKDTKLTSLLQLNYMFLNTSFEKIQAVSEECNSMAKAIIFESLPFLMKHEQLFKVIWKPCEYISTAMTYLNNNEQQFKFKAYTRKGYYLDVFAELKTDQDKLKAQQFIRTNGMGTITNNNLVILDINVDDEVKSKIQRMR